MGDFRFFITPIGLVQINELPKMWGLIEVFENGKVKVSHNPFGKGNMYGSWNRHEKNTEAERKMMYSALRRLEVKKLITQNL